LLLAAALLAGGCSTWPAPDWFTDRGNLGHTAHRNEAIQVPLEVRWQAQLGASVRSSVIGAFGMLYVGADDSQMYALDPLDGSVAWTYQAGGPISASATGVGENKEAEKYLWFQADDGVLYALDAEDGSERWQLPGGVGTFHSPTNYATGLVFNTYMATGVSSKTRAVEGATGAVVWESSTFNITTCAPMHGAGRLHQGLTQGGTVFRTYAPATGAVDWTISSTVTPAQGAFTSGIVDTDVEIGDPVKVYLSPQDAVVRAVTANAGATIWEQALPGSGPVRGMALTQQRSPNVLIVSQRTELYSLDPVDGTVLWQVTHGSNSQDPTTRRFPQPAIYGDYVFHVEGGDELVARLLTDGSVAWSATLDASTVSSPTVGGGTVYIATSAGTVYAFSPP
jgi:outer membrane protein assembly factor BamB